MASEHVLLSPEEQVYGQGNLLQIQLDLINSAKNIKIFKSLRKDELNLKIQLKNKVELALENLDILDKMLPRAKMKEQIHQELELDKERVVLEDEAETLRKKIESLKSEY